VIFSLVVFLMSLDGSCSCQVVSLRTSCFPKPGLNLDGFAVLRARFTSFLRTEFSSANITANVSAVLALPLQNSFLVTIQSCQTLPTINSSAFFDDCLCHDSPNGALASTSNLLEKTIVLHNASCSVVDLEHLERLRFAVAEGLSQYGTRQADVFFSSIRCVNREANPRIRASFKVSTSASQMAILSDLADEDTWEAIYESFMMKVASFSCLAFEDFTIEYLPGMFVPMQGSGSGSGSEDDDFNVN
jgi:hypothetical protein